MRYAKPNVLRLDINYDFLKKQIQPLGKLTIERKAFVYAKQDNETPINFRITTVVVNEKVEVIGYLSEFTAFLEDSELNLKDISRFIQNSFLNYQLHFEKNAPDEIKHIRLDSEIEEESVAQTFLDLLDSNK